MMVYTVTLNPALDCFLFPERFRAGADQRYESCRFLPGGKGINVSLLLHSLGAETKALGLAAGFTGRELVDELGRAGCPADFLFLKEGVTRVNVKITPPGQPETALNGGGPAVSMEDLKKLAAKLKGLPSGGFLALCGSLPASLPAEAYAWLAGQAPRDVYVAVDASGPALCAALQVRPFLVKPNLEELGAAFGVSLSTREDALPYARKLQKQGARNVAVSMGAQGALLLTEAGDVLFREALPGRAASAVGAGDSFVAGFLYGWQQSGSYETALNWGVSAGAATAFTQGIASGGAVRRLYAAHFQQGR